MVEELMALDGAIDVLENQQSDAISSLRDAHTRLCQKIAALEQQQPVAGLALPQHGVWVLTYRWVLSHGACQTGAESFEKVCPEGLELKLPYPDDLLHWPGWVEWIAGVLPQHIKNEWVELKKTGPDSHIDSGPSQDCPACAWGIPNMMDLLRKHGAELGLEWRVKANVEPKARPLVITRDWLVARGACGDAIEAVMAEYGDNDDEVTLSAANLEDAAIRHHSWWIWLVGELPVEARSAWVRRYEEAKDAIRITDNRLKIKEIQRLAKHYLMPFFLSLLVQNRRHLGLRQVA
jgi:hypothetical protein